MGELPFPTPPLRTDMVLLRPWRETDIPARVFVFSDPVVQRFAWASTKPYTEDHAQSDFVEMEQARVRGEQVAFAVVEPDDHEVVLGGSSLHNIDSDQGRAAVGFELMPTARGRGVATHAVRLIAGWAFDELGVARLELTYSPDNRASQRVAERCGFTREGVLRSHMPFKGGRARYRRFQPPARRAAVDGSVAPVVEPRSPRPPRRGSDIGHLGRTHT